MNGSHVTEHYTAYLEGSLPEALWREVEAHLGDCPQCAAGLAEMRALVAELRALPEVAVPEGFTQRVSARVPRRAPRAACRWQGPALAGGLLAAALAAVLVVMHCNPAPVTRVADSRAATQLPSPPPVVTGMPPGAEKTDITEKDGNVLPAPIHLEAKPLSRLQRREEIPDPFTGGKVEKEEGWFGKSYADTDAGTLALRVPAVKDNEEQSGSDRIRVAALPRDALRLHYSTGDESASGMGANKTPAPGGTAVTKDAPDASVVRTPEPFREPAGDYFGKPVETTVDGASMGGRTVPPGAAGAPGATGPAGPTGLEAAHETATASTLDATLAPAPTPKAGAGTPPPIMGADTPTSTTAVTTVGAKQPASSLMSKIRGDITETTDGSRHVYATSKMLVTVPAQPLSFGKLQVEAKSLPDGKGGAVLLRVDGTAQVTGNVAAVQPAGVKAQSFTLSPQARETAVTLPKSKQAAVLTITLRSGDATERCALIAPAPVTRKEKISLRTVKQPAWRTLATLAGQAGVFVLCPQSFAEQKLSLTVKNVSPRDALATLADQHQHRAELAGNVLYITPVK